jgi:hypothetical protein
VADGSATIRVTINRGLINLLSDYFIYIKNINNKMNAGLIVIVSLILIGIVGKTSVKVAKIIGVDTSEFEKEPFYIPFVIDKD